MSEQIESVKKYGMSAWFQSIRPFSLTASITPVLVGAILAVRYEGVVLWPLLPFIAVSAVLLHAATNLVSDYFDYKNEVDKDYTFGSSRILFESKITPRQLYWGGIILFAIGFLLGIILIIMRGYPVLVLGIIGILGGYFYCGYPVGYKYVALGDFLVFALMGPLMVIGSYFTLTGSFSLDILYISLPIGFLVAAILHANNLRDIMHDTQAKVKTLASVLGYKNAKIEYYFLILGSYISILIMIVINIIPVWSILVFLSLPPAIKNIITIKNNIQGDIENIAMIDVKTAQVHFQFGLLLILSIGLGKFL